MIIKLPRASVVLLKLAVVKCPRLSIGLLKGESLDPFIIGALTDPKLVTDHATYSRSDESYERLMSRYEL